MDSGSLPGAGLGASTSLGQAVFGSIFGTVTDQQGNAVAGAKVTVTSVEQEHCVRLHDERKAEIITSRT